VILQGGLHTLAALTLEANLMEDLEYFFNELKEHYSKEKQNFPWTWESVLGFGGKSTELAKALGSCGATRTFVYYIAYNLSKNILHGPLPSHLHSRMILENKNTWSEKYVKFLEGK
jgi:hypothetical protein